MAYIFTWVPAYAEFVKRLPGYQERQEELIEILKQIGIKVNEDEDMPGHKIPLKEIDPYTFLFYLGKPKKHWNRIKVIRKLCEKWQIPIVVHDTCGIPSANHNTFHLFPYKHSRLNNEINRLWNFFTKASEGTITDNDFADVGVINPVGKTKLTEALFIQNPSEYLCLNEKSKPLLRSQGINTDFNTYNELQTIYQIVKRSSAIPFYEISHKGHIQVGFDDRKSNYFRIGTKEGKNGPSRLPEMLESNIISIGWSEIGNLEEIEPFNKKNIQIALQTSGMYLDDNRTASKKAGEILTFKEDIKPGDFVFAADGAKIKAIGKVISAHYAFDNDKLEFPHVRCVEWLKADISDLNLDEGLLTSVWKYQNEDTLKKIQAYIEEGKLIEKTTNASSQSKDLPKMSTNLILYGPPGTGKTYRTVDHAVAIIEHEPVETITARRNGGPYDQVKQSYDEYVAQGRIAFCTFHQSMSYEDFIEGIKPLKPEDGKPPQYDVVDGIFKRLCVEAAFALYSEREQKTVSEIGDFSQRYEQFASDLQERKSKDEEIKFTTVSGGAVYFEGLSSNGNIIVKHKDGERTYTVSKQRAAKLSNAYPELSKVNNIDSEFREVIGGSNATSYWAILNALRHYASNPGEAIQKKTILDYEAKKEAIKEFKLTGYDHKTSPKFVLIIDEINRGNVAQIFGELITLIEADKRLGEGNEIRVTLPYSRESFTAPPNLYIIGTMNTADRSVEALDTALRRRFAFTHMQPDMKLLEGKKAGEIDLKSLLEIINKRLEVLLDADHTIGHAWLKDIDSFEGLKMAFKDKIMPLLQEFFFNDYEKLALVVGMGFFEEISDAEKYVSFASVPDSELVDSYKEKRIFSLKAANKWELDDFKKIYPQS